MENIIVKEGGSVERLLSSEVFMAWMIFIKLHFIQSACSKLLLNDEQQTRI